MFFKTIFFEPAEFRTRLTMRIPDDVKAKLLWAFDDKCAVDSEMFLTILRHEQCEVRGEDFHQLILEVAGIASDIHHRQ